MQNQPTWIIYLPLLVISQAYFLCIKLQINQHFLGVDFVQKKRSNNDINNFLYTGNHPMSLGKKSVQVVLGFLVLFFVGFGLFVGDFVIS